VNDLVKTNQRFTLGFVPVLKARIGEDGKKRLYGVASSTVMDRHGDTMARSALDDMLAQSQRGLTIFLNHSYNVPEDVAGTVERASLKQATGDIHDLSMDIIINEKNERAVKAWEAIHDQGIQLGLSIGAMIPDGGAKIDRKTGSYTIDHVELVETSIVGVPANPRSWIEYATKALRKSEAFEPIHLWTGSESNTTTFNFSAADDAHMDAIGETEMPEVAPDTGDEVDETNVEPEAIVEAVASAEEILALASAVAPLIPDATDATVTVETPFATINVDTGNRGAAASSNQPSQEAPPSDPETESATTAAEPPPPWLGVPGAPPVQQSLDIGSMVATELQQSALLIARLTRELGEARGERDTERTVRMTAERERDQASSDLTKVLRETEALMTKLAATPAGRRTTYHEAVGRFEALKSYYGEELTDHLARSTT